MTSFAFILGTVPLAIATGASANSRHSIGTGVIGGTLAATVIAIFFIPMFYWAFATWSAKLFGKKSHADEAPDARTAGRRIRSSTEMRRRAIAVLRRTALPAAPSAPTIIDPTSTIPAKYQYQIDDVADTANTQWWKQFDDPVLDQLIVDALAGNKNVMIAAANVEQAAGVFTTRALAAVSAARLSGRRARASVCPISSLRQVCRIPTVPIRHSPPRAGRSICGGVSAGRPSRRARTCSRHKRRAAAYCCRWCRRSRRPI